MPDYLTTRNESYGSDLAEVFLAWEKRLRGWQVWDYAVNLEPPFSSITAHSPIIMPIQDNARLQSGFQRLFGRNQPQNRQIGNNQRPPETNLTNKAILKPPYFYRTEEMTELQLLLPPDLEVSPALTEQFRLSLTSCPTPISFEYVADANQIIVQIACDSSYALHLKTQLETFFPSVYVNERKEFLTAHFDNPPAVAIADFGLSRNFLMPLNIFRSFTPDPLTGLISSLGNLQTDEKALFQILFQPTQLRWTEELQKIPANSHFKKSFQEKNPAVLSSLKEKLSSPLFAVVVRIGAQSASRPHSFAILKRIGANFTQFASPNGNELVALSNDNYSDNNHLLAILNRTSYRSGMILNAAELSALAHLPSASVRVEKLERDEQKTKVAPPLALGHRLIFGENIHNGQSRQVSLSNDQRSKHIHVIGASGSGKSTLLLNLIRQDLEIGQGLCVIDPHGDLIDQVVEQVPENRIKDVILFDPADAEFPIGFNILSANSELEKTLLSSDLVATFRRMSTSWGDVMDSVLANAILAFVESERGGTLFDLKRFLVEKDFRTEFLMTVKDDAIRYFWQNEFPLITGKPQSSILIRLDAFLRQKLIRNIVCQKENKIGFRAVMDNRKILLVKLSQGLIGEENSILLGTFLVSKLYQTALSRQDSPNRPFFSCYLDEFQHFITPSMENILSGARKYNLGLVLAHQEFRQLQSRSAEVASSVLSNCYTRICFRLGDTDAEKFASGFSFFDGKALQNLGIGEAVGRVERAEFDFNLTTAMSPKTEKSVAEKRRTEVTQNSRETYAKTKAEVEAELNVLRTISQPEKTAETHKKPITVKRVSGYAPPTQSKPKKYTHESIAPKATLPKVEVTPPLAPGFLPPQTAAPDKDPQAHRYLQLLVKRMAESSGFLATIEKKVFGGAGRIDVSLESETEKIAVEVSVTNEADYEVQNIRKCLTAGYAPVALIASDRRHLDKIGRKAEAELSPEDFGKIRFFSPEEFHAWLETFKNKSNKTEKVKGFKVSVKLKAVDEKGVSTRKRAISDVIFGGLKKLRKKDD